MSLASEFEDSAMTMAVASTTISTSRAYLGLMVLAMNPTHHIYRTKTESASTGSEPLSKRLEVYYMRPA
jgi:hypothetical protein